MHIWRPWWPYFHQRWKKIWRRRWEGAESLGWIILKEEIQSFFSSALLRWGDGPRGWHTQCLQWRCSGMESCLMWYVLFKLVIVLLSHPGFSLPKGTVSWNHQWCPQWHQQAPVPQVSGLPDLWEASIWREVRDSIKGNFWYLKGKLCSLWTFQYLYILSRGLLILTTCIWLLASRCNLIYPCFSPLQPHTAI